MRWAEKGTGHPLVAARWDSGGSDQDAATDEQEQEVEVATVGHGYGVCRTGEAK